MKASELASNLKGMTDEETLTIETVNGDEKIYREGEEWRISTSDLIFDSICYEEDEEDCGYVFFLKNGKEVACIDVYSVLGIMYDDMHEVEWCLR